MELEGLPEYDEMRSMGEERDKPFAPRFPGPGRGDNRNLALVIPSRVQGAEGGPVQALAAKSRRRSASVASASRQAPPEIGPVIGARYED
jgi:hypothetical protein